MKDIRWIIGIGFFVGMIFLSWAGANGAELENQREHESVLVEKAKKEGNLVFYTSMNAEYAQSLTQGFEKKYPFLKTDIFRSGHEKLLSRLSIEYKAGRHTADVVTVGEFEGYHLKKHNLISPYSSPQAAGFPKGLRDPEGYWTDVYDNLIVVAYNTAKVKPNEAPSRYEDLFHTQWADGHRH